MTDQNKASTPKVMAAPTSKADPIVPDPSPSDPVKAVMEFRTPGDAMAELLVAIRIAGAHYLHAEADHGGTFTH